MNRNKCFILDMHTDVIGLEQALEFVFTHTLLKKGIYICLSNVHMCMEVLDSNRYREIVNGAGLVIPDGKPISWAQKLLGFESAKQVRGQTIMNRLCESSGKKKLNIGLYGGATNEVLNLVNKNLRLEYEDINITFSFSPPFRVLTDQEDFEMVQKINSSNVDILFVGLGCPKQEMWMADHKDKLNCMMLGVGAAFDFIAGSKKHAPTWMQELGLEWLFRLCSEPQRLGQRYLKQNPRFIYYFLKQLTRHKLDK